MQIASKHYHWTEPVIRIDVISLSSLLFVQSMQTNDTVLIVLLILLQTVGETPGNFLTFTTPEPTLETNATGQ